MVLPWFQFYSGGVSGRSSENTSGNSLTIGNSVRGTPSSLILATLASIAQALCRTSFFAFIIDITLGIVPRPVPLNLNLVLDGGVKMTGLVPDQLLRLHHRYHLGHRQRSKNIKMESAKRSTGRRHGFSRRCAALVKEQRARVYILRRCATMLLCWYIHGDD
ncbi:hypothetical protein SDJN02_12432, partial [Cucurbita argyrosperma subsp. argyrosperma]